MCRRSGYPWGGSGRDHGEVTERSRRGRGSFGGGGGAGVQAHLQPLSGPQMPKFAPVPTDEEQCPAELEPWGGEGGHTQGGWGPRCQWGRGGMDTQVGMGAQVWGDVVQGLLGPKPPPLLSSPTPMTPPWLHPSWPRPPRPRLPPAPPSPSCPMAAKRWASSRRRAVPTPEAAAPGPSESRCAPTMM